MPWMVTKAFDFIKKLINLPTPRFVQDSMGNTHIVWMKSSGDEGRNIVKRVEPKKQDTVRPVESKGTDDVTPKKKSVPDWLKERWEAGNNFNKENRPRYPYNEVELEAKEVGGKKYVVDS